MARLEPLPYVRPERPRNLRLADLYLRSGEATAEAERRSGDIQAQLWGRVGAEIGQTATNMIKAPQELRESKAREAAAKQSLEAGALQLGEAKRQVNDRENFDLAMGQGSRQKTLAALKDRPELFAKAQQHFESIDTSMKKLMGDVAAGVADFGYTPEAAIAGLDDLIEQGFDERKLEQYRKAIVDNPESVKQIVQSLLAQSPDPRHQALAKPQLTEVSPGASLVDPRNPTEPVFTAPNKTAVPKSLQSKEVLLDGQPAIVNFDPASGVMTLKGEDVTARVKPIPPTKQAPTTRYQQVEVIGDDGKTTKGNFDSLTGETIDVRTGQPIKNPRPPLSASEQMDSRKFAKAAPVIKSLEELSQRININQGVYATMAGGAAKAKAKVNLDDDVAEYESIIMAFAPMVARALGHTGVLTQMDVDSAKALFPKPTDSQSLRDRKVKRLNSLIADIEAVSNESSGAPSADAPQPGDIEYDMNGNKIKPKGKP